MISPPSSFPEALDQLPRMGLGVGFGIGMPGLDPTRLFSRIGNDLDYVETMPVYRREALDDIRPLLPERTRFLMHYTDLSIAAPDCDITAHVPLIEHAARVLDAPWFTEDLGYWRIDGKALFGFMPVILSEASLDRTAANLLAFQDACSVPYLPENPAFQHVYGDLHVLDFMTELSLRTGCGLMLDIGHLYSYQSLIGRDPLADIDRLLAERVIEVHVAGSKMVRVGDGYEVYTDNHSLPLLPEVFEMFEVLLPRLTNLRAVTVEVDFNQDGVDGLSLDEQLDIACDNFFQVRDAARTILCPV